MEITPIYRVQDRDGRGPWRPGFSDMWMDQKRDYHLPSWVQEFGLKPVRILHAQNLNVGCGCRTLEQLKKWFSEAELKRLALCGYKIVEIIPDVIAAESEYQLLFGCRLKLKNAGKVI